MSSTTAPKRAVLFLPALVAILLLWAGILTVKNTEPPVTQQFSDCADCPVMIWLPAGTFRQGDVQGTGDDDEVPLHIVTFARRFAVSQTEITYALWDVCVAQGACDKLPEEEGESITRSQRPVQNASWQDATSYTTWLSTLTGQSYRLLSESEFEYAARAGSETRYPWGNEASRDHANYGDEECCGGKASGADQWITPSPVASFPANAFGLHDMAGNVQEWVKDCWVASYDGAPSDGSARAGDSACDLRVLRGGSWSSTPKMIRPANRDKGAVDARLPYYGFRVARDQ